MRLHVQKFVTLLRRTQRNEITTATTFKAASACSLGWQQREPPLVRFQRGKGSHVAGMQPTHSPAVRQNHLFVQPTKLR